MRGDDSLGTDCLSCNCPDHSSCCRTSLWTQAVLGGGWNSCAQGSEEREREAVEEYVWFFVLKLTVAEIWCILLRNSCVRKKNWYNVHIYIKNHMIEGPYHWTSISFYLPYEMCVNFCYRVRQTLMRLRRRMSWNVLLNPTVKNLWIMLQLICQ